MTAREMVGLLTVAFDAPRNAPLRAKDNVMIRGQVPARTVIEVNKPSGHTPIHNTNRQFYVCFNECYL